MLYHSRKPLANFRVHKYHSLSFGSMCNVSYICLLVIIELEVLKQFLLLPQCAAVRCVAYTTRRSENFSVELRNGNPEATEHSLSYQTCRIDDLVSIAAWTTGCKTRNSRFESHSRCPHLVWDTNGICIQVLINAVRHNY